MTTTEVPQTAPATEAQATPAASATMLGGDPKAPATPPAAATAQPEAAKPAAPAATTPIEFKAPEGRTFDAEVMKAYTAVVQDLKLEPAAAQKVLDTVAPVLERRAIEQQAKLRTEWAEQTKADKEVGGDELQARLGVAAKFLAKVGSPELRTLLDQTGLGNHPEVIRAFYRAGKLMSEDSYVAGSQSVGPEKDPAKVLYPNQK